MLSKIPRRAAAPAKKQLTKKDWLKWAQELTKQFDQQHVAYLSRPRLHTAIFAEAWNDKELQKVFAANNAVVQNPELFERQIQKRRQDIDALIGNLDWSAERLELFMQCVVAYRKNADIQSYLRVRREFPEVDIQVGQFGGIEALFALEKDFERRGIDPQLIAAALDAVEDSVDALCLRLLELLAARESLPKSGPGHIEKRRSAISDATVNYLIATMLEAYDWNEHVSRVPASLVVLIRHQLCGPKPDLDTEARSRERRKNTALSVAQCLNPNETLSVRKLAKLANIPRSTAARHLANPEFQSWLDRGRRWVAEGIFDEGKRVAIQRIMGPGVPSKS